MADAKPTIAVAVSADTVTLTVTGAASYYRARIETSAGVSEEEKSRTGLGDIVFTSVAAGQHNVMAWPVDVSNVATGPPSRAIPNVYVEPTGAITASGSLSEPLENFRALLSNSANFQALVGAGDASAALAYIHIAAEPASTFTRPAAVIWLGPGSRRGLVATADQHTFGNQGTVHCRFEIDIPDAYDDTGKESEAYEYYANKVGEIIDDMAAAAKTYLDVRGFTALDEPTRTSRTEESVAHHFIRQTWAIAWGGS